MSEQDDDNDERRAILHRRSMFIASALAGMTLSACGSDQSSPPQVCLSVIPDRGTGAPDPTAPPSGATTGSPPTSTAPPVSPEPCLSAPVPRPTPCLEMAVPPPKTPPPT